MSLSREAAFAALLSIVAGAYPWKSTPSRRLRLWDQVGPAQRPALFQFEGGRDAYDWKVQPNAKRTLEARLFVYVAASDASPGASQINAILDALDAVLAPSPGFLKQTLGGTCDNARIKDVPLKEPGDLDGDGILVVQIEIILP